ncbi:MAG TPA: hypothetical protein VMU18_09905 [Rhodoblastus sp.]|nr:hypothetical protein [Rhodoblastus sp.]
MSLFIDLATRETSIEDLAWRFVDAGRRRPHLELTPLLVEKAAGGGSRLAATKATSTTTGSALQGPLARSSTFWGADPTTPVSAFSWFGRHARSPRGLSSFAFGRIGFTHRV